MSSLVCSISGSPIVEGVICSKNGFIYEKSTIKAHLSVHHKCPHTEQPMEVSDLVEIKCNNSAFLSQNKSVAEYLEKLSSEYDALILETHQEKQSLLKNRQQLCMSLYQQDAALRVISKLKDEIAGKKENLSKTVQQIVSLEKLKAQN